MRNKWILFTFINVFLISNAFAIEKNTAKMQAMDKITGRVSVVNVPVGGKIDFGSLSIVVRHCATRPEEETPDNFAFVDVVDKSLKGEELNIFNGGTFVANHFSHNGHWLYEDLENFFKPHNILVAYDGMEIDF